ncbi:MAG: tRNA 2-thiouridine(34) synthase MnmA [Pseudomonadota bacterium]
MNATTFTEPVVVALSGGVDSSVAALLLKQAGASVIGLHMTNWDDADGHCNAADDLADARRVAELLDVPFQHVNFTAEYRDQVFAQFLADYAAGLTPNPDVLCNRDIKFGVMLDYARRLGAATLATGHYAATHKAQGSTELMIPADRHKDQTYFLHAIEQQALAASVFPLADLSKREVRELAHRYGLPTRAKKDSTGICFIGERPFQAFLETYLPGQPGPMRTLDGRTVGQHRGAAYYTVGQRKGLGIGGVAGAIDAPWYVADRDMDENTVYVVQGDDHPRLRGSRLSAGDWHWIAGTAPSELAATSLRARARIRHGHPPALCTATRAADGLVNIAFDEPQWAIAPGQYVVLYSDDTCLGGGTIRSAETLADALDQTAAAG